MSLRTVWLTPDRSVPLGGDWRSRPLVFSLLPAARGHDAQRLRHGMAQGFHHRLFQRSTRVGVDRRVDGRVADLLAGILRVHLM